MYVKSVLKSDFRSSIGRSNKKNIGRSGEKLVILKERKCTRKIEKTIVEGGFVCTGTTGYQYCA
jgi:hypothetical protein